MAAYSCWLSARAPRRDQSSPMAAAAFAATDWCFRLQGWPIMPPLIGVYVFTDRPPRSPPTGVLAYTVGWSHHRRWASTTSPLAHFRHHRLVFSRIRMVDSASVDGRHRHLHRSTATSAANWCFRLHSWPVMPLLMGVYVFTAGLLPSLTSVFAYTVGGLRRR
uniref:HGWP repeat containing protein-like n=1 Tax=Oryza sativa subsp. japonica TaxID=39947 RepID=Q6K7B0_ORYSJ|nr:HGWP repeat containing protein-like [Oryza sativa Japonica Group]